jgi:hypothetical protein
MTVFLAKSSITFLSLHVHPSYAQHIGSSSTAAVRAAIQKRAKQFGLIWQSAVNKKKKEGTCK